MAAVALHQIWKANTGHLTPWKGGGFGMFSHTISLQERTLVCIGLDEQGNEARIKPIFEKMDPAVWPKNYMNQLKSNPTLSDLQHIAETLKKGVYVKRLNYAKHSAGLNLGWEINEPQFEPIQSAEYAVGKEQVYRFPSVIAAIYEMRYDARGNSVKYYELLRYRADQ
jgi:hypothetical protein